MSFGRSGGGEAIVATADCLTRALEARRARGIQIAVALSLVVVVLRATPWTRELMVFSLVEHYAYDSVFIHFSAPEPPPHIVIVDIDDESLQRMGRYHSWHRDLYAHLLDGPLREARVVAIDLLFTEPDVDPHRPSGALGEGGAPRSGADAALAAAMKRHGRVVLAAHWRPGGSPQPSERALLDRLSYPGTQARLPPSAQGLTLALPTPVLAQAAAAVGYVDIDPDSDHVFRRFEPLRVGPGGRLYPHFGVAVASVWAGLSGDSIVSSLRADSLILPGTDRPPLPLVAGKALINYCGPAGTVARVGIADVLDGAVPAGRFRDKIAIIGSTAPGLYDIRPAVYRAGGADEPRVFFGVETNAGIVSSLLFRDPLADVSGSYLWGLIALLMGGAAGVMVWSGALAVGVALGIALLLLGGLSFLSLALWGLWLPYGAMLLGTALPMGVGLYARLTSERDLIRHQFGVYVSPDVLQELMETPDLTRHSRRRLVTLLFCDVRGSTALCEGTAPEVWVAQLNEYLTQMSRAVFDLDGYLDKFMGDELMAVWNAFGTQEEAQADLAVRAGLQMLARLELLNRRWALQEGRTPLAIGIGVHSGEAVIGNVGSEERMQFTAIGDAINTASRIEEMCKEFGVPFIISEHTARLLGGRFGLRELGMANVRGRSAGIRVYEVARTAGSGREGDGGDAQAPEAEEETPDG